MAQKKQEKQEKFDWDEASWTLSEIPNLASYIMERVDKIHGQMQQHDFGKKHNYLYGLIGHIWGFAHTILNCTFEADDEIIRITKELEELKQSLNESSDDKDKEHDDESE